MRDPLDFSGKTVLVAGGMEGRWLWQPEEVNPAWV